MHLSFTAAPAALLGGWLLMRPIDGDFVPGFWWTAAHAAWLAAFALFGVMLVELRRRGGHPALVWAAMAGAAANAVQLGLDLGSWFPPGPGVVLLDLTAHLFYVALAALAITMAAGRAVTPISAGLVTVGVAVLELATLTVGGNSPLVAVGMSVLWLGSQLLIRDSAGQVALPDATRRA
ncbi:hypothetical protein ACIBG8_11200 [Nonomuraea sp. NPDC050556]|uniref:hypothetical protein n=1 Tax=Nonomuraea sp. NPDC050556 TaxID=3364369 RepID=UPI0037973840